MNLNQPAAAPNFCYKSPKQSDACNSTTESTAYSVLRLLLPLEKLPGLGVRLLMIITNALFFKSNEGTGINKIPQSSGHFFVPIIILNQMHNRELL